YDRLYHDGERGQRVPGSFAAALNAYNQQADGGHAITRVFPYGGDLEMYCADGPASCSAQDLMVMLDGGMHSVAAYGRQLESVHGQSILIAQIIDGSIRADYPGSLNGFNKLSPKLARTFADKVARAVCSNPYIDGVQFDLEPFDV